MSKQSTPNFKIVILDDNEFYNKILTRFLTESLKKMAVLKGFTVDVSSFTSYIDCSKHLDSNVDLLFIDYYLGDGYNASHMINLINNKLYKCKIVVVSQIQTMQTCAFTLLAGAYEFIKKDKKTLFECNDIAETIISAKLGLTN
jgi:response regulator of citrate/malate metabolism